MKNDEMKCSKHKLFILHILCFDVYKFCLCDVLCRRTKLKSSKAKKNWNSCSINYKTNHHCKRVGRRWKQLISLLFYYHDIFISYHLFYFGTYNLCETNRLWTIYTNWFSINQLISMNRFNKLPIFSNSYFITYKNPKCTPFLPPLSLVYLPHHILHHLSKCCTTYFDPNASL